MFLTTFEITKTSCSRCILENINDVGHSVPRVRHIFVIILMKVIRCPLSVTFFIILIKVIQCPLSVAFFHQGHSLPPLHHFLYHLYQGHSVPPSVRFFHHFNHSVTPKCPHPILFSSENPASTFKTLNILCIFQMLVWE